MGDGYCFCAASDPRPSLFGPEHIIGDCVLVGVEDPAGDDFAKPYADLAGSEWGGLMLVGWAESKLGRLDGDGSARWGRRRRQRQRNCRCPSLRHCLGLVGWEGPACGCPVLLGALLAALLAGWQSGLGVLVVAGLRGAVPRADRLLLIGTCVSIWHPRRPQPPAAWSSGAT